MAYEVEFTDPFEVWWETLTEGEQESVAASVGLIERLGPVLPFPYSSNIKGSKHGAMRELRVQHKGSPIRIFYAFDPRRVALLLLGGDKTGDSRFYERMIPLADRLLEEHFEAIQREKPVDA